MNSREKEKELNKRLEEIEKTTGPAKPRGRDGGSRSTGRWAPPGFVVFSSFGFLLSGFDFHKIPSSPPPVAPAPAPPKKEKDGSGSSSSRWIYYSNEFPILFPISYSDANHFSDSSDSSDSDSSDSESEGEGEKAAKGAPAPALQPAPRYFPLSRICYSLHFGFMFLRGFGFLFSNYFPSAPAAAPAKGGLNIAVRSDLFAGPR